MKKGLTQYMEEKQQEYDERVKYWEQLVKAREEHVRQKEKQWDKISKILKAKKRPSSQATTTPWLPGELNSDQMKRRASGRTLHCQWSAGSARFARHTQPRRCQPPAHATRAVPHMNADGRPTGLICVLA